MSVAQPQPTPDTATPRQVVIVQHSTLYYWWPVWAVGFLMGVLTLFDGHFMSTVPKGTEAYANAEVRVPTDKEGKQVTIEKREVLVLPPNGRLTKTDPNDPNAPPAAPRLHIAKGRTYGVIWATVLLLVIVFTNVPLRGMWSVMVIVLVILLSVIFALAGWWGYILFKLALLDIRINAGGYFYVSGILFVIWLFTMFVFDKQIYMIFAPGQLRVCSEIGGGQKVYDAVGMTLEKQRSDFFRHWILGLGSGDLVINTAGAQAHHFEMHNVLFIGKKVQEIEDMLKKRAVVETR